MLFKVYSFCVESREINDPEPKHGIDNDAYMGTVPTPFTYRYTPTPSIIKPEKEFNYERTLELGDGINGF